MVKRVASDYLLIADISDVTTRCCALARENGLEPVVVLDGEAAIDVLHSRGLPRLMIVNPSLPKVDGFAVIAELRKLTTVERVPALVISSFATLRGHATRLQSRLGISAVFAPTIEVDQLRQVVRGALVASDPIVFIDLDDPSDPSVREQARLVELEHLVDLKPVDATLEIELAAIAREFGVTTVLVTLVDRDRAVFKAAHGLPRELVGRDSVPRNQSLCRHVVEATSPAPLIVPDAASHPAFADNPLVRAGVIGSYVGVPLLSPTGHVLGSLCLIDRLPWLGSAAMIAALTARARAVMATLLVMSATSVATWREDRAPSPAAANAR